MLLNWVNLDVGPLLFEILLLFGIALAFTSIGFYRVVYFVSIGYALSIAAMGIVTPIRHVTHVTWVSALQNGLLVLWGLRLAVYLIVRESRKSYRKELKIATKSLEGIPWLVKAVIWLGVSFFYVLMFSPSLLRLTASTDSSSTALGMVQVLGLLIMGAGLVLETLADQQKSNFKKESPNQYCDVGLYQWVRYPNYLGEIIFWVGNWITAMVVYNTLLEWIISSVGMVFIVLIMIGSTERLKKRHNEKYGDVSSYQTYIRTVPMLVPFVPIYNLKKNSDF